MTRLPDDPDRDLGSADESALEPNDEVADSTPEGGDAAEETSQKSYQTILEQEIAAGLHELERPTRGLAMSALSAGLDIGFSVLLIAAMLSLAGDSLPQPVVHILVANLYSVGFIFVIFGRSELFTEHTSLAVLPVLDGSASLLQLARLWGIVYAANLVGIGLFAAALAWLGPAMGLAEVAVFEELASKLTEPSSLVIFVSAILAGWMMGLLSWLVTAGRDTIGQIFFVWLVTGTIGFAGLHHCIVGSGEVLTAVFAGGGTGWPEFGRFLLFATLGNVVGGTVFVAIVKYAHATSSDEDGSYQPDARFRPSTRRRRHR